VGLYVSESVSEGTFGIVVMGERIGG